MAYLSEWKGTGNAIQSLCRKCGLGTLVHNSSRSEWLLCVLVTGLESCPACKYMSAFLLSNFIMARIIYTLCVLSPVSTKLRKGDIGLPFVRQSVRPSPCLSWPTFWPCLLRAGKSSLESHWQVSSLQRQVASFYFIQLKWPDCHNIITINLMGKVSTFWTWFLAKTILVPGPEGLYLPQNETNIWPTESNIGVIWTTKSDFLQISIFKVNVRACSVD